MSKNKIAYIYAGLSVFFWATVPTAFKISLNYLSIVELLFYSSVVSAVSLFIILLVQKKLSLLKELKRNDYLFSGLLGFINPFVYYLILFKSYSLLPAQQAQPLNLVWGILLVVISIPILKQSLRLADIIGLFVCFLGVVVISTKGDFAVLRISSPLGVGLALASSFLWAIYWILNVKDTRDPIVRLFLNFAAGAIFIFPLFLINFRVSPWQGITGAVYVGLFEMGLTFFFWISALKLTQRTVNVAILIYLVPFLSFVFINIFLGERILVSSVIGALLIVVGTLINKYREFRSS